jgi:hypothetical protein
MENMHQSAGGDPEDGWPTEECDAAGVPAQQAAYLGEQPWGQDSGQAGEQPWAQPAGPGGSSGRQPPPDRGPSGRLLGGRRLPAGALRWSAGLALVGLLAVAAVLVATSASQAPAGPTGQAAALNTMLNSAAPQAGAPLNGHPGTRAAPPAAPCRNRAARLRAAGHPAAARIALWRCRHPLRRLRALGGMHGQFTFETKSGVRTIAFERGVIESISGTEVVVQAKDGTTWTWVLYGKTVIRESRQRVAAGALSDGQTIFVGGPVVSGTYEGRLIVIRVSSRSTSPAPSSSSTAGS